MENRIKQIRTSEGLSQTAFAEKLNISRNFVSLIETGERKPSDRTIIDICNEFHINETWLRTGEGDMKAERTREQEIADIVRTLVSAEDLPWLVPIVDNLAHLSYDDWMRIFDMAKKLLDIKAESERDV